MPNRLMRHLLFAFALCAAAISGCASAQGTNLVPVKAEMLEGSRLLLRTAGCSVDLPGRDWKWMTYEGGNQNYICSNSNTGALFLAAVGRLTGDLTAHQPQSLLDNASKAIGARNGKLENGKFDWVELPGVKKCVRIAFNEVESSGKRTLAVIYLAQTIGDVSLKLQYTGPSASEPEPFKRMVDSLKMLPDSVAAPKTPKPKE